MPTLRDPTSVPTPTLAPGAPEHALAAPRAPRRHAPPAGEPAPGGAAEHPGPPAPVIHRAGSAHPDNPEGAGPPAASRPAEPPAGGPRAAGLLGVGAPVGSRPPSGAPPAGGLAAGVLAAGGQEGHGPPGGRKPGPGEPGPRPPAPGGAPSSPVWALAASPGIEGAPTLPALVQAALAHRDGLWGDAVLEIAVGAAPPGGLVLAGLEEARRAALGLRVSPEALSWLQEAGPPLPARFFTALRLLRFQGEIWAPPEGTALAAGAPALRLRAPLTQALLLADALLMHLCAGSAAATRTAALVRSAEGRPLVELSDRPGPVGAAALRGAQIGGLAGTTQLDAAMAAGLPLWGRIPASTAALWADPAAPWMLARELFGPRVVVELPGDDLHEAVRRLAAVGVDPGLVCARGPDLPGRCAALRRALDRSGLRLTRVLARVTGVDDLPALKGAPVDAYGAPSELLCPPDAPLQVELAELPVDAELPAAAGRSPYTSARGLVRGPGGDLLCRVDAEELHRAPQQAPLLHAWARDGVALPAPAAVPARPLPGGWTVRVADDLRPRSPPR